MLQKQSDETRSYILDLAGILPSGVTATSVSTATVNPSGLTVANEAVLSTETEGVESLRGVSFEASGGTDGYEYRLLLTITGSNSIDYEVISLLVVSDSLIIDDTHYYGSVWEASEYLRNVANTSSWDTADNNVQRSALQQATQMIDRLNFKGSKSVSTQALQFPRSKDTAVPSQIKQATYHIAVQILDDIDVELEYADIRTTEEWYAKVRTKTDTTFAQEHTLAGIPSVQAWHLLKPFLRDGRRLTILRG